MKLLLVFLLASPLAAQTAPPPKPVCDATLWEHVYHSERLKVIRLCTTVTGIIVDATKGRNKDGARREADGDSHNWLKLDPGQDDLLLRGNVIAQNGNIVFELICRYPVTQKDAISSCQNFPAKSKVILPPVGSHVAITGSLIEDLDHQPIHREIHPVSSIIVVPVTRSR
jgi:hypothetical protein